MRIGIASFSFALGVLALAPSLAETPAEQAVFGRERLVDVSWGEIEVRETGDVEAPFRDGRHTFPHALGLDFVQRRRAELASAIGAGVEIVSTAETSARFWIALDPSGNEAAWRSYRDHVIAAASRLSPAGYERFLEDVASSADLPRDSTFAYVACVSRPRSDHATGGTGSPSRDPAGNAVPRRATWSMSDSTPTCSPLRRALQYAPVTERLASRFNVAVSREEWVSAFVVDHPSDDLLPLPPGASLAVRPAEPATIGYSASSRQGDSEHREEQLPASGDDPPVIVAGDAAPVALPAGITRKRSILLRWTIATSESRLGPAPDRAAQATSVVYEGVFSVRDSDTAAAAETYRSAIARELGTTDAPLDEDLPLALHRALPHDWLRSALVVTCREPSAGIVDASYCVGRACAPVTNARAVCDEIRRAMEPE